MPTKKPSAKKPAADKDIVTDPKQAALLKAIATGDASNVDLDLVKQLMDSLGLSVVAQGLSAVKGSRVEKRRRWMTATELSEEEIQTIKDLPEVLGKAPILTEEDNRAFTQTEIDAWMEETLVERPAEDIFKGRNEARRASFFNHASFLNDGDPYATGTYASPKHGYKFTVTKQERGGAPNLAGLEELLDAKTWNSITDEVTVRQVNEEKLQAAIGSGKLPLEAFAEVVPAPTIVRVLRVDPLKEGDPI